MNNTVLKNRKVTIQQNRLPIQKYVLLAFTLLISLTLFRCANMQRPTGGPKDSIAPKLLNVSPNNFTRNFDKKEVVLQFDEYIKLSNQFKEFSISPDVDKQPEYKIKKKSLHIILPDSLEANTTYTINFGKGLVDFNESNPFENYNYVFATGPELDSLTITGSVQNAFTKSFEYEKDKDVRVLLIPTRQDSIFGKKKATIFSSIDSTGNFKFNNLREDTYRIYAIKEQNNDRIYNNPDELLGFLKDSIHLNKNIDGIKIAYSKGKVQKFRTMEKKIEKNSRILLTFNQPLDTPTLRILEQENLEKSKFVTFSAQKDSAFIFVEKMDFDSIKFELSNNKAILDTILLKRAKAEKYERNIIPQLNVSNKVEKINHIRITSEFPISDIDKNKIVLNEDSVSRRNFQLQKDTLLTNTYTLKFNWRPKKNYELIIQENAIKSAFATNTKESKTQFTLDETDNFGDIKFTINGLDSNIYYVAELIDEKKEKVFNKQIILNTKNLTYSKFPGGKYGLRIYMDSNKNGRWDGADIYTKTQAEPIWYLDKTFTIRANWEQTENIEVKFDN